MTTAALVKKDFDYLITVMKDTEVIDTATLRRAPLGLAKDEAVQRLKSRDLHVENPFAWSKTAEHMWEIRVES